jgi:aconitase B
MTYNILPQKPINTQLVNSLVQIIRSLSQEERHLLEKELFFENSEPSTQELMQLALVGNAFNFLENEPDIYTSEDGEPV